MPFFLNLRQLETFNHQVTLEQCPHVKELHFENRRLRNELIQCHEELQGVIGAQAKAQAELCQSLKNSDAMIDAVLARMTTLQSCSRIDVEELLKNLQTGFSYVAKLKKEVEV